MLIRNNRNKFIGVQVGEDLATGMSLLLVPNGLQGSKQDRRM